MKWRRVVAISLLLSAPAFAQEELEFDVRFSDTIITAGSDALVAGDRIILNDTLLDQGIEVGRIHGTCTMTDPKGFAICNVTFVLPDGNVATQFVNSPPPEKHFPVLGGTGAYSESNGSGTLIEHGDGTGSLSFSFAAPKPAQ